MASDDGGIAASAVVMINAALVAVVITAIKMAAVPLMIILMVMPVMVPCISCGGEPFFFFFDKWQLT
jgi:hypothetical protein